MWTTIETVGLYDLEGTFAEVIASLSAVEQRLKITSPDANLRLQVGVNNWNDDRTLEVQCERLETDEEYNNRKARDAQMKAYRQRQYEQLKKEFDHG